MSRGDFADAAAEYDKGPGGLVDITGEELIFCFPGRGGGNEKKSHVVLGVEFVIFCLGGLNLDIFKICVPI